MSEVVPKRERGVPILTGQRTRASASSLDLPQIMNGIGATAFCWDFATDAILWDRHAASLLGVETAAAIAVGTAFNQKIALDFIDHRRKAMTVQAGDSPARSETSKRSSAPGAGTSYRLRYRFHPLGRSDPDFLILEEDGLWWPDPDGHPASAQALVRVITDRYEHEQRLRYRAEFDDLTGQLNRAILLERLSATIADSNARHRPCAYLIASVNGLDVINETFGFNVGDEVLAGVATLMKQHLRSGDELGRVASNKFGIVLNDCGPGVMRIVADRLMSAVRTQHIRSSACTLAASVSIGGVALPDGATTTAEASSRALQALDRARRKRLDGFMSYEASPVEDATKARNSRLADALMTALDEQRMVLELQPMVTARTGEPAHFEALLRMIAPDGTRVSAGDFMPIAEQLGLSRLIDLRAQELAITLLKNYPTLHVSLNISGLTSGDNDWLVSLHRLTGSKREITQRLTIEITETAAIHDLDQTMAFVDTIKELGCMAAIDDFGVGYTNFRNLKLLHADLVKIDGAFVKNVCQDRGDQVFIKSMVELARAFGMRTVAEWVGDGPTATYLIDAGIDYLQGYHYGAPAPPETWLGPPPGGRSV